MMIFSFTWILKSERNGMVVEFFAPEQDAGIFDAVKILLSQDHDETDCGLCLCLDIDELLSQMKLPVGNQLGIGDVGIDCAVGQCLVPESVQFASFICVSLLYSVFNSYYCIV